MLVDLVNDHADIVDQELGEEFYAGGVRNTFLSLGIGMTSHTVTWAPFPFRYWTTLRSSSFGTRNIPFGYRMFGIPSRKPLILDRYRP